MRGVGVLVAEPERDNRSSYPSLEEVHGGGVSYHMRAYAPSSQRRARWNRQFDAQLEPSLDSCPSHAATESVGDERIGAARSEVHYPAADQPGRLFPERDDALLSSLASQEDGLEIVPLNILYEGRARFRDASAGIVEELEQEAVATSRPGIVARPEHGAYLGFAQEAEQGARETLEGNRRDALDLRDRFGAETRASIAQEASHGGEPAIDGARAVAAFPFQVAAEGQKRLGVEVGEANLFRRPPAPARKEVEEQLERVAVGRHRPRAQVPLVEQVLEKEGLDQAGELLGRTHLAGRFGGGSKRAAADANSPGTAERYQ